MRQKQKTKVQTVDTFTEHERSLLGAAAPVPSTICVHSRKTLGSALTEAANQVEL
jgi:hypothetical protein